MIPSKRRIRILKKNFRKNPKRNNKIKMMPIMIKA
jgi:hypothetical protein